VTLEKAKTSPSHSVPYVCTQLITDEVMARDWYRLVFSNTGDKPVLLKRYRWVYRYLNKKEEAQ